MDADTTIQGRREVMADILIKNMEMPKSCEDCPFTKKVCDIYFTDKKTGVKTPCHYVDSCSLTGSWFDPFSDDSPKPCPLVLVPEHGRLIDADELLASDAIDWGEDAWYGIKNAPTVLEGNYGSDN